MMWVILTQEIVRAALDYDPDAGTFTWKYRDDMPKKWNTRWVGKRAGGVANGYYVIRMYDVNRYGHRLAYLYMTGSEPEEDMDHIDGDKLNNKWANLRAVSHQQNCCNRGIDGKNKSGFKGVYWNKHAKRWTAFVGSKGANHYLGLYNTAEAAHAAYCKAAAELHGEFFRSA